MFFAARLPWWPGGEAAESGGFALGFLGTT
jgi:hypothetical protein